MSLGTAMFSRLFSRENDDPIDDLDPEADHVGVYEVVIRDVDKTTPWGKRIVNGIEHKPPATNGCGHLRADAFDEVEERLDDVDEHRGEVVATIAIDVDAWEYHVRMEVDG